MEFSPRPLLEFPSLMPRLPSLLGLGDRVNGLLAGAFAGGGDDLSAVPEGFGAPGLSSLDVEYLRCLAGAPGWPVAMVPSDVLPESWRFPD